jgi:hypothetical protein
MMKRSIESGDLVSLNENINYVMKPGHIARAGDVGLVTNVRRDGKIQVFICGKVYGLSSGMLTKIS